MFEVDTASRKDIIEIQDDVLMGTENNLNSINEMNLQTSKVLDASSQMLIYCTKKSHQHHHQATVKHIGTSLGQQVVVVGLNWSWIDHRGNGDLYSLMYLITRPK